MNDPHIKKMSTFDDMDHTDFFASAAITAFYQRLGLFVPASTPMRIALSLPHLPEITNGGESFCFNEVRYHEGARSHFLRLLNQ